MGYTSCAIWLHWKHVSRSRKNGKNRKNGSRKSSKSTQTGPKQPENLKITPEKQALLSDLPEFVLLDLTSHISTYKPRNLPHPPMPTAYLTACTPIATEITLELMPARSRREYRGVVSVHHLDSKCKARVQLFEMSTENRRFSVCSVNGPLTEHDMDHVVDR